MAEITPPLWQQNSDYPAAVDRRLFLALTDDEGVAREDSLQVTAAGSGLDVSVSGGEAFVDGTESAAQGRYLVSNDGAVTLAPDPADASNPRYDLVIARVYDSAYSGATDTWALEIVKGTAASSPVEPAVPANSLVLARLSITAGLGTITDDEISDRRSLAPYKAGSPIGTVVDFAGTEAPAGWLRCDGTAISRTLYAPLFDVIGTTFGAGDGSTTFTLPDLRGRVRLGRGTLGANSYNLGDTGGAATVTLTTSQMPTHDHGGSASASGAHNHGGNTFSSGSAHTHNAGGTLTVDSGGAHSHSVVIDRSEGPVGSGDFVYTPSNTPNSGTETASSSGSAHTHSVSGSTGSSGSGHTHAMPSEGNHTHAIPSHGGSASHENRPPYLAMTPIIRAA